MHNILVFALLTDMKFPCFVKGVKQVLVRLGDLADVLLLQKEHPPLIQAAFQPPVVIDKSGADDSFTAAYAVALIERQTTLEALRFAGIFYLVFCFL